MTFSHFHRIFIGMRIPIAIDIIYMRTHIPLIIEYSNIINFTVVVSKMLLRKYISYTHKDWE